MSKYIADEILIRKRMIDKRIKSVAELSRNSGVSKPKIYGYLRGETPLATTFLRLCNYLGLDADEVVIKKDEVASDD